MEPALDRRLVYIGDTFTYITLSTLHYLPYWIKFDTAVLLALG